MKPDDMAAPSHAQDSLSSPLPRPARLLLSLLGKLASGRLDIVGPDGRLHSFSGPRPGPQALIRICDWDVCSAILRAGDIGFAEAYVAGRWDTPGLADLLTLVAANHSALDEAVYGRWWGALMYRLRHLLRGNTRFQARRNIHAHYDLGNRFYSLWLDETMTYSAALFDGRTDRTLAEAQTRKYQRIIDRLGLKPGDRVLEIGCGWGGFAEHAAGTCGVRVHGITLSTEQLAWARARIDRAGLGDLATFDLRDYRDVLGEFDAIVSIEMFEAVGQRYWPTYFSALRDRLRRGGRALVQTITIAEPLFERYRRGTDFIQQYVFPGGMLPSLEKFRGHAARQGLLVEDVMPFRHDYAETLRRWRAAFNSRVAELQALGFDERFARLWNFYLAYCEAGFRAGTIDVVQAEIAHA